MNTRRLVPADTADLIALRREALHLEPLAFAASPADDVALVPESVRGFLNQPDVQAVFGCFDDRTLVGMIGVFKLAKAKQQHKATIWGLYVQPRARRRGLARSLLNAALAQAQEWAVDQVHLGVSETAPAAKALYESAGFRAWGREPRALQWAGRVVDEYHLVLELRRSGLS
jgi:ribosomal protein S18 acetylase RimI-like enzyme